MEIKEKDGKYYVHAVVKDKDGEYRRIELACEEVNGSVVAHIDGERF